MLRINLGAGVFSLVPKLLLGNAPVREALLRMGEMMSAGGAAVRPVAAGPAKHSFGDSGVPKLELGHEGTNKSSEVLKHRRALLSRINGAKGVLLVS